MKKENNTAGSSAKRKKLRFTEIAIMIGIFAAIIIIAAVSSAVITRQKEQGKTVVHLPFYEIIQNGDLDNCDYISRNEVGEISVTAGDTIKIKPSFATPSVTMIDDVSLTDTAKVYIYYNKYLYSEYGNFSDRQRKTYVELKNVSFKINKIGENTYTFEDVSFDKIITYSCNTVLWRKHENFIKVDIHIVIIAPEGCQLDYTI